eukprot:scaffold301605_cov39-Tisochrysis_lutea.AAC.1
MTKGRKGNPPTRGIGMARMLTGNDHSMMPCACTADEALKNFWAEEVEVMPPTRRTLGGEHTRSLPGNVLWEEMFCG